MHLSGWFHSFEFKMPEEISHKYFKIKECIMKKGLRSFKELYCVGLALVSSEAFSQVQAVKEGVFKPGQVSVELKPFPTVLSAVPGVRSVGFGIELSAGGNVSTFGNAYAINANLPSQLRGEGDENTNPVVQKFDGYAADVGVRYNATPVETGSWYAGGKVGYSMAMGQWGYRQEKVNQTIRMMTPGLEGGYRWIWNSGVLLRLGGGLDANVLQQNSTSPVGQATATTADAEDKVKGYAKIAVAPRGDVGVGYAF